MSPHALGLDVGGTKILGCLVDADGNVLTSRVRPTPTGSEEILETVALLCEELRRDGDVGSVGLSVAGWVDRERRTITFSPHLPWRDDPIADTLSRRLALPVTLDNDANAAAWAEFRFGTGASTRDLVFVTVGTGIGSGIVIDGRLLRGANGMAGELGHTALQPDGPTCPCGRLGCVDMYASGRALQRAFQEQSGREAPGLEIGGLILEGDGAALAALDCVARSLGRGIADAVMTLDPQIVAIGGGLSTLGESLRGAVERAMFASLGPNFDPGRLRVVLAKSGRTAGAIGAADLSRRHSERLAHSGRD